MSKTYCSCIGMRGEATRRGGRDGCRVSCQSFDGSVIVRNWYDNAGKLTIRLDIANGSSSYGDENLFTGTFEEFKKKFRKKLKK